MNFPWWHSAVVYQVYPRSFADGDGDGIGDLAGLLQHVDHLALLGVDVVWLSPVYRSPMDDNGYDISDYQDIDPVFGTLAEFDEVLGALHERGIKLVMDLVVNHTSDEHTWFEQSRSSRDDPRRDWYVWRDPAADGGPPNNWTSFFSGPAWELDEATGQYYLHLFSRKQPDLNWENPDARQAVYAMMRWWLDRGIDGFRMDVINLISKAPGLPDGREPAGTWIVGTEHVVDGPRVHEFVHEMHEAVFTGRRDRLLLVGETPGVTIEQARLYTDPARGELDIVFQFEHVNLDAGPGGIFDLRPVPPIAMARTLARWQAGLADGGWNSVYLDNHDQPRAVSRFGDDSAEWRVRSATALATLVHLQRGCPFVYQGEELGMTNGSFSGIEDFRDIETLNAWAAATGAGADPAALLEALRSRSRDNARTPMQWDSGPQAGFTTGRPWIGVNPNSSEINAAAQIHDPHSVFGYVRRLIALRHEQPVVAHGDFTELLAQHDQVFAFSRAFADTELLVLVNLGRSEIDLSGEAELTSWSDSDLLLGNYDVPPTTPLQMRGWEAAVWQRTAPVPA